MKTKVTELLGIEYPIIQGAMAWVSTAKLAAAVSNAGGAGIIATGGRPLEWVRTEIQKAKTLTDKPFGVNLVLQDSNWEEKRDIIMEEGVSFVTTGAGNPVPLIDVFHKVGIKVIPVVPNVKLAKRVEQAGADAIVVEGLEAGGHIGKATTMALLTQVIPEVNIPVIIAGGIADYRGVAASLLMGADAVQMGTRFYASKECEADEKAKQAIVDAVDTDSTTTGQGAHMVRGLRNKMTDRYHELVANEAPESELIELVTGTSRKAPIEGDVEWGMVQAGQSLMAIKDIKSVQEIIDEIVQGVENLKKSFC